MPSYPILDKKQEPMPYHRENLRELIYEMYGKDFSYDLVLSKILLNGKEWEDHQLIALAERGRSDGLTTSNSHWADAIENLARERSFDVVKEYMEGAEWDGEDHIQALLDTVRAHNRDHWNFMARRWIINYVVRAVTRGVDTAPVGVLVLQGAQGEGKSRWLRRLCPWEGLYTEAGADPRSRDDQLRRTTTLLWNLDELDSVTQNASTGSFKGFLTQETTNVRRAYGRYDTNRRNICSFVASLNPKEFLKDETGNRRFLVSSVLEINADHNIDMRQVFLQAWALYKQGQIAWFTKDEIEIINQINTEFSRQPDLYEVIYHTTSSLVPIDAIILLNQLYGFNGTTEERKPHANKFKENLIRMGYKVEFDRKTRRTIVWARKKTDAEAEKDNRPFKLVETKEIEL